MYEMHRDEAVIPCQMNAEHVSRYLYSPTSLPCQHTKPKGLSGNGRFESLGQIADEFFQKLFLFLFYQFRCHIYSFIYLKKRNVEFIRPKPHYTKTALFLSCHQLYQETLEYYYSRNTFSLTLHQRFTLSDWYYVPRHFKLVEVLHVEAGSFFWKSSSNSIKVSEHTKKSQQHLRGIFWADRETFAPNLKTLIFAGSVPPSDQWYRELRVDTSKERLDEYVRIFEELRIGIGQVVVKIKGEHSHIQ